MKKCFKCSQLLPLSEYYKHNAMKDGHLNKCKKCTKSDVREREKELRNNPEWIDKEKERGREKYYRLYQGVKRSPEANRKARDNYRKKYPEKYKAKIATGKMQAKTKGNHLHHWSYNEKHYKDVIELEPKDHYLLHRHIIYDQDFKMYRNSKGILLKTKKSHIDLLNAIK